ncbi:MAG TPA: nitrous oxide reductase family maturation protein NosD [Phycisphaeraceae bacterium]
MMMPCVHPANMLARAGRIAALAVCAAGTGWAQAQAQPPTAQPLQPMIDQAQPGQTIRVPAGLYAGPVIVNKPLELIGQPGAVIDGAGRGDVVVIEAPDVTFRGFTIRATGDSLDRENTGISATAPRARIEDNILEDVLFGVYLKEAPHTIVRNNTIGGKDLDIARRGDGIRVWSSPDCLIQGNRVHHSRDVVMWFSPRVRVVGNHIRHGRYGLHFMYSDDNVLENNRLEDNAVGAFLMYSRRLTLRSNTFLRNRGTSGYGLGLKDVDGLEAQDNRFIANRVGIYLDNSPASVDVTQTFKRNLLAYNDIGIAFMPSVRRNAFSDNVLLGNFEQVAVLGSGTLIDNDFTPAGRGNFWSDYAGYDQDGDGVGDLPYQAQSLFESLMDREPKLRLFLMSPAQQAVELAARAAPMIRPQPKVTDTRPLMRPPTLAAPSAGQPASGWALAKASLAMLGAGAALMGLGAWPTRLFRRAATRPAVHSPRTDAMTSSSTPSVPVLIVRDLSKRFGRFVALDGVSFEVRRGEALALWGANGAGKTTAIRCVLGLLRYRGSISVAGCDAARHGKEARRQIGYVPQELAFQHEWRVRETLTFHAQIKRAPLARVDQVLAEVGLTAHAAKRVGTLSGGMKQRLALAAALLADPALLVLDEITSSLDAGARRDFLALLMGLRASGRTILFTSHRWEEVQALASRVLVLDRGCVRACCDPAELTQTLGLRTRLRLRIEGERLDEAVDHLRQHGLSARRNGSGVYVEVPPDAKAQPIHALGAASIRVLDFDLEDIPPNGRAKKADPGPNTSRC